MSMFRAVFHDGSRLACWRCGLAVTVATLDVRAEDSAVLNLDTCDAVRAAFREFRRASFPEGAWTGEDGVLRSVPGRRVDLVSQEEFEDFEQELEWRTEVGANSGIMYGVDETGSETFWSGPEMQINDDPDHPDCREPRTSSGGFHDLIAPSRRGTLKPTGDFNHVRIVSRAGRVEHWQNAVVDYEWGSPQVRAQIQGTKFATAPLFMQRRRGHIALQSEGDEVRFRAICIRRLDSRGALPQPGPAVDQETPNLALASSPP